MNKQLLAPLPLVFALLGGTAEAGEWTNENVGSQPGSNGYLSKLAVAPDQSSYAVWLDWTDFDDTQVMLAKSQFLLVLLFIFTSLLKNIADFSRQCDTV